MNILIVEDAPEIANLIQETLERESFICQIASDGLAALELFKRQQPDLIILDLMLPKLDGLEVCTRIRQTSTNKDPYILMLTAKGEAIDRVIGLSTGADDYLVKPFSPIELVARVRALLRRSLRHGGQPKNVYQTAHFIVDLDRHIATRKLDNESEETLELTTLEFSLLSTFMSYPGRVWSRSQLIEKLWGDDFFGDERVVDTHIRRLRKKIEPDTANPTFIKTVVGIGYKFEDN
ncbi:two component transcriptional regulator, winged helix family [Rippkaea orientalis PCC 8801]|uniref:Two component transcriptional regulator, winged helix family n=1 Tax=Rippkaea orientalis (strain PCC 8801 / RF-1) TaxID=41431 RepID=B7JVK0_RIPO1|nr:response regulator transcription factor [Rippkaea orientalis]ACK64571.1 two component transcriptional regulator, winged helix family [Rippkaea orientalis PCC 8801]